MSTERSLEREFLLTHMRNELAEITDPEKLREMVVSLVDLCETQKAMFKQMLQEQVIVFELD